VSTVIILSHKTQDPFTANDQQTMETVITAHTFINIISQGPKSRKNGK
jgi:hypothetical protein